MWLSKKFENREWRIYLWGGAKFPKCSFNSRQIKTPSIDFVFCYCNLLPGARRFWRLNYRTKRVYTIVTGTNRILIASPPLELGGWGGPVGYRRIGS